MGFLPFVAIAISLINQAQGTVVAGCSSGGCEADDDAFAAAQLRRTVTRQPRLEAAGAAAAAATAAAAGEAAPGQSTAAPGQSSRALGVLNLDGYYWPTQPGDISDLRTWCTVEGIDGAKYRCKAPNAQGEDEFGLKAATIVGGSWPKIQVGQWTGLEDSFAKAIEYFLRDESVHAITGGAGWFTWYQDHVSEIMRNLTAKYQLKRKPFLGGAPAMLAALGSLIKGIGKDGEKYLPILDWKLLTKPNDRIVLLTSNANLQENATFFNDFLRSAGVPVDWNSSCSQRRAAMEKAWGIDLPESDSHSLQFEIFLVQMRGLLGGLGLATAMQKWVRYAAQKILVVPWIDTLGYGSPVVSPGAMFHNVAAQIRGSSSATAQLLGTMLDASRRGEDVVGIILESTEMPAYSNWIRKTTGLPVWDSTVLGKCLMASAPDFDTQAAQDNGNGPTLFNTPSFRDCMMGWWDPNRFETSAGYQKDGTILYYDTINLTTAEIDRLTCTGGRPSPRKAIGRMMEEFDTGEFGPPKISASCLTATPCGGRTWQGQTCPPSGFGGQFTNAGGCFCDGTCPAGYYCGADEPFDVPGLEGVPGGQGYVYGIRGENYSTYKIP